MNRGPVSRASETNVRAASAAPRAGHHLAARVHGVMVRARSLTRRIIIQNESLLLPNRHPADMPLLYLVALTPRIRSAYRMRRRTCSRRRGRDVYRTGTL